MRLTNLELEPPLSTIEVRGAGHLWDLHNFADFTGLIFDPASTSAILRWEAHAPNNRPWGSPSNTHRAVELVFSRVRTLQLTEPAPCADDDPDGHLTVESIARVEPGSLDGGHRMYWEIGEPCDVRFDFLSGRRILIAADSLELRPVT